MSRLRQFRRRGTAASGISCVIIALLALGSPRPAHAQADNLSLPQGSTMWHYQCKAGIQCPTRCSVKGSELFSTSEYVSLTIAQIPGQVYWIRIDTGQTHIDYIAQGDQVICSIVGATLASTRTPTPAKAAQP